MGAMVFEAHITISAPFTAASGDSTGGTVTPSRLISFAKASRFALVGLKQRIILILRTVQAAISCAPACQPEPRMPTVLASCRARYLIARPFAARSEERR